MTVSSASLGHAATNPEVGGSRSSFSPHDPTVLDYSRDGLGHRVRGIANRLTFESRLDARDLRNPAENIAPRVTLQATSSTLRQCWRRG